ncbi:hypothetical protein BVRB_4g072940 isoform B [Beta vulgaris subsp. vulgaris]|nr:hypothetical protein BVRB_4g072940 isoform B [Beta vulgaris subsp. vulgaris]
MLKSLILTTYLPILLHGILTRLEYFFARKVGLCDYGLTGKSDDLL